LFAKFQMSDRCRHFATTSATNQVTVWARVDTAQFCDWGTTARRRREADAARCGQLERDGDAERAADAGRALAAERILQIRENRLPLTPWQLSAIQIRERQLPLTQPHLRSRRGQCAATSGSFHPPAPPVQTCPTCPSCPDTCPCPSCPDTCPNPFPGRADNHQIMQSGPPIPRPPAPQRWQHISAPAAPCSWHWQRPALAPQRRPAPHPLALPACCIPQHEQQQQQQQRRWI
jgi:hypothetical protein